MLRHPTTLPRAGTRGIKYVLPDWVREAWGLERGSPAWIAYDPSGNRVVIGLSDEAPPGLVLRVSRPLKGAYKTVWVNLPSLMVEALRLTEPGGRLVVEIDDDARALYLSKEDGV